MAIKVIRVFLAVVGTLLALVGALMILAGLDLSRREDAKAHWGTTEATITASQVVGPRISHGRARYRPSIFYVFEVAGTPHEGECYDQKPGPGDLAWARSVVHDYPKGRHVPVRYDPARPYESCLHIERFGLTMLPVWVGVVFVFLAAACIGGQFLLGKLGRP